MTRLTESTARRFFADHSETVLATVAKTDGSAPRDSGTTMLVSHSAICGTIGGGVLEHRAIDHARELLAGNRIGQTHTVSLGPESGQCCGGRVDIHFEIATPDRRTELLSELSKARNQAPAIYIFGGGHVGTALAIALAPLPFRVHLVETRPGQISGIPGEVATHLTAIPESMVEEAPHGSAFIVLTHDHALDFLITATALKRSDSRYVGMIGSKTKRHRFRSWFREHGGNDPAYQKLVCPIGSAGINDKRPEVIAALTVAELVMVLSVTGSAESTVNQFVD